MTGDSMANNRHSIRLNGYDYRQSGAYFVTVCAHNRACLFGEIIDGELCLNDFGRILEYEWLRSEKIRKNVEIDKFVIMPNHLHGIIITDNNVGATRRVAPRGS